MHARMHERDVNSLALNLENTILSIVITTMHIMILDLTCAKQRVILVHFLQDDAELFLR